MVLPLPGPATAGDPLTVIVADIDQGRFRDAEIAIAQALASQDADTAGREALLFQRERMRRIRLDFTLDATAVRERIRTHVPDLGEDEFQRWDSAGLIERLDIDGEPRYFNRSVSNLFRLSPEAAARRAPPVRPFAQGPYEALHRHHRDVVQVAKATGATSVLPRRVRITHTLSVKPDAVPAGETVRAWLPYPRAIAGQQEAIALVTSQPARPQVAPERALQRTAYLEQPAVAGVPTTFSVTYEVTVHARRLAIDPERVVPAIATPELAPFLAERAPHVVFNDDLRRFSEQVVGGEKNPYRVAQKLFAAVDRIPWAGAREYSTISNISDHAFRAGHADCGQQTLLLITLLRMNGIPARWQSGWAYSEDVEGHDTMHDWGALYLAPYGWVPMDVTTGQLDSDDPALRWFYLGGLDAYRVAFNDDYSREFIPAKQHVRSETVDLQRGEVEWKGGNLYFDQWDYTFEWTMLPRDGRG
ncbi:transglutaminase domain-containing protein [Pseudoxanthomonas sp.]|uniref:transglutaminase-like domain-containing protein n=1 Tax=Pseudoxanthomonas sp. TaxID=1871049 RepID=UPI0028C38704|nr:transglutaminase domain-containing protein [Pseudoxanthomonas sp.]